VSKPMDSELEFRGFGIWLIGKVSVLRTRTVARNTALPLNRSQCYSKA